MKINLRLCMWSAVLAAGCSTEQVEIGSVHVKSSEIRAANGGTIEVSQTESAELAGTKLDVPAGALSKDTTITVGTSDRVVPTSVQPATPAVDFGPDGTSFKSPATLTLPFSGELPRARVYAINADGTKFEIAPRDVAIDRTNHKLSFQVSHFTRFQGGQGSDVCAGDADCAADEACNNGRCGEPQQTGCQEADCGVRPGVPTYTCADGTTGGFTGQCLPNSAGQCAWEIRDCAVACTTDSDCDANQRCESGQCVGCNDPNGCAHACTTADCGPALGIPNWTCVDGSIGGPTGQCLRNSDGSCGWEVIQCERAEACDANGACPTGLVCTNGVCLQGSCDPATNACTQCQDDSQCARGELCVAGVCQVCSDPNGCGTNECTVQECGPGLGLANWICVDGTTGGPTGRCLRASDGTCGWEVIQCERADACDSNGACPAGQACMNGVCVDHGCDPATGNCACQADTDCAPGMACINGLCEVCRDPAQCGNTECAANECGPELGLPNWICVDGTTGGPTGRCLRHSDGTCGWEVHQCDHAQACDANGACPAGLVCENGLCMVSGCDPATGQCGVCRQDSDCASNESCTAGQCVPFGTCNDPNRPCACTADSDCPAGLACLNGLCGPTHACQVDSDCPAGLACETATGQCQEPPACGGPGQPACLGQGDVCENGGICGSGLSCCYPCGIQGCHNVCEPTCDPNSPGCFGGCMLRP